MPMERKPTACSLRNETCWERKRSEKKNERFVRKASRKKIRDSALSLTLCSPPPLENGRFLHLDMSLADLERSLLSRLEKAGVLCELRARAREAALGELDLGGTRARGDSSPPSASTPSKQKKRRPSPPPPSPPAETVVALELIREFLEWHGFRKARSLLEAEAGMPPMTASSKFSIFGRRALASLVGLEGEEEGEETNEDEPRPPPLLYSVMSKAASTSAEARRKNKS